MIGKRRHEGYLIIDNRNSPGTTPEMLQFHGRQPWTPMAGEGEVYESATVTCSHCQRVVILNPNRSRPRNYCAKCDHYVCDTPACAIECHPMNRTLDLALDEAHKLMAKNRA